MSEAVSKPVKAVCKECNYLKVMHAKGMCRTCYDREHKRKKAVEAGFPEGRKVGGQANDDTIWKIRFRRADSGQSETTYSSRHGEAYAKAGLLKREGRLLFFGRFKVEEELFRE